MRRLVVIFVILSLLGSLTAQVKLSGTVKITGTGKVAPPATSGPGIAIDRINMCEAADDASAGSIQCTTSAAVATNGFIVLTIGFYTTNVTLSSVSGGGLTWVIDKQAGNISGANTGAAIVSAQAPSGLASSTTITATYTASTVARSIAGTSFTGVATSSPVDVVTPASGGKYLENTNWATDSTTISAGSMFIAICHQVSSNYTNTPTGGAIEAHEINGGVGTFASATEYRIETSGGSYTLAGTWSTSGSMGIIGVAYKRAP